MGKGISKDEYQKAKHQLKTCRVVTCPNAFAAPSAAEGGTYCGACKTAKRTAREYERAVGR